VKFILTVLSSGSRPETRLVVESRDRPCRINSSAASSAEHEQVRLWHWHFGSGIRLHPGDRGDKLHHGAFGWTSTTGLESRDRSGPADDLKRDFVMHSSAARTFKTALSNGQYAVTLTMGDNDYAHDNMVVKANGSTKLADVDTAQGAFAVNTFNVTVSNGNLEIEFSDAGGSDPTWVVNGLTIAPASTPPPAGCDRAQFISDVTVPDGTTFAPGAAFNKTWRLKNVGTCTWTTSYSLVFDSGEKMGGPDS